VTRRWLAIGALALAGGAGCAARREPPLEPEVLLLVTIDTLRPDRLGCGGDARARTPFLDRLARDGTQMACAIASAPLTLPSHATILSGRTPPEHGARDNGAFRVPDDVPLVPESFRAAGWSTAAFVAAVPLAARFGLARGFDVYDDSPPPAEGPSDPRETASFVERPADEVNDAVFAWLDGRDASRPVFLWVHYFDPHGSYRPPPPLGRLEGDPYRGEITFTDRELGRLTRRLDARFAERRTCVTADHGESLGEHGEETHGVFVYEATTRVPWILAGPGAPSGRLVMRPASLTEIAPALLAWRGLAGGEATLAALLERGGLEPVLYSESLYPELRHGWAPLRALRTDRWKVIRAPQPELYDLDADPGETRNLWSDPAARAGVAPLVETLEDPRWEGRAPEAALPDAGTQAALRSLGYVGASRTAVVRDDTPRPDPKDRIRIEGLLSRAGVALEGGSLPAARRAISLALSIDPRNKESQLLLARIEARAGNFDRAFEVFDWCLELPPASGNSWVEYERGRVALDAGKLDVAEEAFAHAVEGEPLNVDARYNWGVAAWRAGRWEDAATRWRDVLALDPDHGPAGRWLPDAIAKLEHGS